MSIKKGFMVSVLGLQWDHQARLSLSNIKEILAKLFSPENIDYIKGGYAREPYYFNTYIKIISPKIAILIQQYKNLIKTKNQEQLSNIRDIINSSIKGLDLSNYSEDHFTNLLIEAEKKLLKSKHLSGVILFRYNDHNKRQIKSLINGIRSLNSNLFIAVDQEGGLVQRLVRSFSEKMPRLSIIKDEYQAAENKTDYLSVLESRYHSYSAELSELGITHNLAPVCDLDLGCEVISKFGRSAGREVISTTKILQAILRGMHNAGIVACLKHFPGHGGASADSHFEISKYEDQESLSKETEVFKNIIGFCERNKIPCLIMPAHVIYPSIDPNVIATRSSKVLKLAGDYGFTGDFISDCVTMKGASPKTDLHSIASACLAMSEIKIITLCHYDPIKYLDLFSLLDPINTGQRVLPEYENQDLISGTTDVGATE